MKETKNFEELYKEYLKEIEEHSNGLVQTDKTEFFKFVAFYNALEKQRAKELKRMKTEDCGL